MVTSVLRWAGWVVLTAPLFVGGETSPRHPDTLELVTDEPGSINMLLQESLPASACAPDPIEQMFAVHWTHVPKAGGTTLAEMTKAIACQHNPQLREHNPCCRTGLCLAPKVSCHSSAISCPFVTGIGFHLSNMDRLMGVPCCGTGWAMMSASQGFLNYAIKADNDLKEKHNNLWSFEDRVRFLTAMGVAPRRIEDRLRRQKPSRSPEEITALTTLAASLDRPFSSNSELNMHVLRCSQRVMNQQCCNKKAGSHSLTMLRHPYMRAISGYLYRGHSPNYDVFQLRPGLFHSPRHPRSKTAPHPGRWSFTEFTSLSEYSNVFVKMFGASKSCEQVVKCHRQAWANHKVGNPCVLTSNCHAYRNGTFLQPRHLQSANEALDSHRFVGLVEAYNSSLMLLAAKFELTLEPRFFANARPSVGLSKVCRSLESRRLRSNKAVCLESMRANRLDAQLYEHSHRRFCRELADHGLRERADVAAELRDAQLCQGFDFSDAEAYCSSLASPAALAKLEADEARCAHQRKNGRGR